MISEMFVKIQFLDKNMTFDIVWKLFLDTIVLAGSKYYWKVLIRSTKAQIFEITGFLKFDLCDLRGCLRPFNFSHKKQSTVI